MFIAGPSNALTNRQQITKHYTHYPAYKFRFFFLDINNMLKRAFASIYTQLEQSYLAKIEMIAKYLVELPLHGKWDSVYFEISYE